MYLLVFQDTSTLYQAGSATQVLGLKVVCTTTPGSVRIFSFTFIFEHKYASVSYV